MLNERNTRQYLKEAEFENLFIEELGWDRHTQTLSIIVDETEYHLTAIAEKRGMIVFECPATGTNGRIPDYATRRKIQKQVAKSAHEHFIIYTDTEKTTDIYQWVKREQGKPDACREHRYNRDEQSGESLIQKLQAIAFTFEEEEQLTLFEVTGRVGAAFYAERVTKKFYDRFKKEHDTFLKFLNGIPDEEMQKWYVSVMLNRLMFIYFIQKKNFLDSDQNYLSTKLTESQANATNKYYKDFLCPLFFEGFAKPEDERSREMKRLLGKIPYLNGGIFQQHQLETLHGENIDIPDKAFEQLFSFFEQYQWHLDDRPLRNDNEINPDVLGYIFEKYINQKQMGAYYTKEDITEYISKNTIIPFLFDKAKKACKIAFEGDASVWNLLQEDPDRYIYDAVKKGVDLDLPEEIAAGIDDVSKRTEWNTPADPDYALPTEIWRETVARQQRYETIRSKLTNGEITDINDLITYNLNIRQFAQDVIENCEGPELLRACYKAITEVTILDPTCGSGAFLFAALNILEPLYEACLDRMQIFLDEVDLIPESRHSRRYSDFRDILERIRQHPNREYFVLKSIIINNLYGVDIMDEAVEICKLRLFLKMVAQIDNVQQIEPLPDIDFNVQAGNSLVGYTTYDAVEKPEKGRFDFENAMKRIKEKAEDVKILFQEFRRQQTTLGGAVTSADKQILQSRLQELEDELNLYLAEEYGVDPNKQSDYENWLNSHKPFHWFIAFYEIVDGGGFDVIIGNPPYLELNEVDYTPNMNLVSYETRAIHAMCIDCSLRLLNRQGCLSMIVPIALVSSQRMQIMQTLLEKKHNVWYANYSWRPAKLFDTVNRPLTICVATPSIGGQTFSTNYQKWTSDNRDFLMYEVDYAKIPSPRTAAWAPKLGAEIEAALLEKCLEIKTVLRLFTAQSQHKVYHRRTGGLYWKVFTDFPPKFRGNGKSGRSSTETSFSVQASEILKPIVAILSSNLFWWWYTITTNCRDLAPYDIQNFRVPKSALYDPQLLKLAEEYLEDLQRNSIMQVRVQKRTGRTETQSFKIQKSKHIIDKIDRVLAQHYGFTDEQLDFIINYDIKYRMGLGK
ncbi:MAG: Eco57I restriction-modification methylase domain-containing protein [Candidatus Poribacteria bacterium]|nr:Eco57I restriction-modification methylase domain-containing protein [Candidatus Poribacteria bacterium]